MKRWIPGLLCFFIFLAQTAGAQKIEQKDINPPQKNVPGGGRITRIDYTRHKMIVHFETENNERATVSGPGHRNAWRLYDAQSRKQYNLIYVKNIRVDGETKVDYLDEPRNAQFYNVHSLKCEAHFERPGKGVTRVDMIEEDVEQFEGRQDPLSGGLSSQWPYNVYNVRVLPYDDKEEPATVMRNNRPPVAAPKSAPATKPAAPARKPAPAAPAKPRPARPDSVVARTPPVKTPAPRVENFDNRVETGKTYRLSNLLFPQSDYRIQAGSYPELNKLAEVMRQNPEIRIELAGHTDNVGDPKLNVELSRKRVEAVKSYLVSKGIDRERIRTVAYGGSRPVADNTREETRRLNRRVEVKVE
ncbi:OmpA family protein [Tellurirhabdus rosea]|uniref:OmpA family protein n=1 Tax=Tellurirhabdus rosea TaxID=2674997 RepID=UPI00224FADB8|nr:OmpA family protein [Tellurirhabdus rosea]